MQHLKLSGRIKLKVLNERSQLGPDHALGIHASMCAQTYHLQIQSSNFTDKL